MSHKTCMASVWHPNAVAVVGMGLDAECSENAAFFPRHVRQGHPVLVLVLVIRLASTSCLGSSGTAGTTGSTAALQGHSVGRQGVSCPCCCQIDCSYELG